MEDALQHTPDIDIYVIVNAYILSGENKQQCNYIWGMTVKRRQQWNIKHYQQNWKTSESVHTNLNLTYMIEIFFQQPPTHGIFTLKSYN